MEEKTLGAEKVCTSTVMVLNAVCWAAARHVQRKRDAEVERTKRYRLIGLRAPTAEGAER